jgi:hypothetical protein
MKNTVLYLLIAMLMAVSAAPAATVTFIENPGAGIVDVAVRVLDTVAFSPPSLAGYDLNITYNTSNWSNPMVSFVETHLGSQALSEAFYDTILTAGNVNIAAVSLLPAATLDAIQPDDFDLAVIRFDVIGAGPGNPTLVNPSILDGFGNPLSPNPIPEPATAIMTAAAVICLALWRRRTA